MPTRIHEDGPDRFSMTDDGLLGASLVCERHKESTWYRPKWVCELVTDDNRSKVLESEQADIRDVAKGLWEAFAEGYYDAMNDANNLMGPDELAAYAANPDEQPAQDGYRLEPDNTGDFWSAYYVVSPDGRTIAHLNLRDDGKLEIRRISGPYESPLDAYLLTTITLEG